MSSATNPLLQPSTQVNQVPPFADIREEHYLPAIEAMIAQAREQVAAIRDNPAAPNFANTIEALETSGEQLDYVTSVFYNMTYMAGTDTMQEISDKVGPLTAAFSSDVASDAGLFARINAVYTARDTLGLDEEQYKLLENTYRSFVRGGALLPADKQAELKEVNQKMATLGPQFSFNKTKAIAAYELWIENEADLAGLPAINLSMAKDAAVKKGRGDAWLITLDMPSFIPFMRYIDKRALREELWRANSRIAQSDGEHDNRPLLVKIIEGRHQRAQLLGYDNHASFVLEERMAKDSATVQDFLASMMEGYFPAAKRDFAALQDFAKSRDGLDALMPWDVAYYRQKLEEARYEFNAEVLRPYFKMEQVLAGTFAHFAKLFGVAFTANTAYPVWDEKVTAYDVKDTQSGAFLGTLYADFFPRPEKRSGAWQSTFRGQGLFRGKVERPVVTIVCNFTPSTSDQPSLLTFDEVLTLFHEMGHAMHNLLAEGRYQSLTGTSVHWDFVELPSQLQENWCYEPETLALIARHHETGAALPEDLIAKLQAAKNFMIGWDGMTQMRYAMLDMAWHTAALDDVRDVEAFEDKISQPYRLFPKMPGLISPTFTHVFAGGYAAGYYSYKWAEVLEADAFEAFLEEGLYNPDTAARYRKEILAKGGIAPPDVLYARFRGRKADPQALFRREKIS